MARTSKPTTIGAEQARQELPALLAAAAAGRTTIITRHGRPVAAIVPADRAHRPKAASLRALAGTGRGLWGASAGKAIDALRDEWNR